MRTQAHHIQKGVQAVMTANQAAIASLQAQQSRLEQQVVQAYLLQQFEVQGVTRESSCWEPQIG